MNRLWLFKLASLILSFYCAASAKKISTAPGVIRVEYYKPDVNDQTILPREAKGDILGKDPIKLTMKGVFYVPKLKKPTRMPLIIFLHGNHAPCKNATSDPPIVTKNPPSYPDECIPIASDTREIPSNLGYEYIANELVPKGYAVMAPNFNSVNLYTQPFWYCKFK
jgi:hypothetical protein